MPGEQHGKTCYRARIGRFPIQVLGNDWGRAILHDCKPWGADQRANVTKGGLLYPSGPSAAAR
jgi:hypothetical protein